MSSEWTASSWKFKGEVETPAVDQGVPGPGVTAANIFYPDDRVEIVDTSDAPWRSVAHLVMYLGDTLVGECSGLVIGPDVVLTAAHCLYDDEGGYWFDDVLVVPGETRYSEPFGYAFATNALIPTGWGDSGDPAFDFGLVLMEDRPFGDVLAPYDTVAAVPDDIFHTPGNVIATAGYPGDKPFGSQWFTSNFFYFADEDFIYTQMDWYLGQSGSPIYFLEYEGDDIVSVTVAGVVTLSGSEFNIARRMSPVVVEALIEWCSDGSCSPNIVVPVPQASPTPPSTPTQPPPPTATVSPTATTAAPAMPNPDNSLFVPGLARAPAAAATQPPTVVPIPSATATPTTAAPTPTATIATTVPAPTATPTIPLPTATPTMPSQPGTSAAVSQLWTWYDQVTVYLDEHAAIQNAVLAETMSMPTAASLLTSNGAAAEGFRTYLDGQTGTLAGHPAVCDDARAFVALSSGWVGLMSGWLALIFENWPFADYFEELEYASDQFFDTRSISIGLINQCAGL